MRSPNLKGRMTLLALNSLMERGYCFNEIDLAKRKVNKQKMRVNIIERLSFSNKEEF